MVPRYYFHTRQGRATMLDHDGLDLADLQEAVREAKRRASAIASTDTLNGYPSRSLVIVVADEQGSTVFEAPVDEHD
jgi:hypothetical protein